MHLILVFASAFCFAADAVSPKEKKEEEPTVWQKVDRTLTEGAQTIKKKFMTEEPEKPAAKTKARHSAKSDSTSKEKGGIERDVDKVTDSLNEAWDGALKGVGRVLKTQNTEGDAEKPETKEKK